LTLHVFSRQSAYTSNISSKEFYEGGYCTFTIEYDTSYTSTTGFYVALDGTTIFSKSGAAATSRLASINETLLTFSTGTMIKEGGLYYSHNGTVYEYAELTHIWGGGSNEFVAILTFTKTVYPAYTKNLNVTYNDRWSDTSIFQTGMNFDVEDEGEPDPTCTDYIYLVWKSDEHSRSLQFKKLCEFDSTDWWGGISWVSIVFQEWVVTNDYIAIALPVGIIVNDEQTSLTYRFKYFLIERNPPFRVFNSPEITQEDIWYDPDYLTVWKRIA
jgi:hypothetical protein